MRSKSIDCSVEVVAEAEVEAEADDDDNDDCELLFDDLISDPGLDLAGEWRISIWRLERSLFIPEFVIVLAVVAVAVAEVAAKEGYIKESDIARLLKFRSNPSDESWREM